MIEFIIPGEPRGKGRPRVVRLKNGASMSYTPDKTVAYEELARQRFRQQWPYEELPFPNKTPVGVTITACFGIPKSASKKAWAAMLGGQTYPSVEDFFRCLDKQAGSGISTVTIHKLRKIATKEGFLEE